MIKNTNVSDKVFDEPKTVVPELLVIKKNESSIINAVIGDLEKRRENVLTGGINCIPLPFPRFRSEVPGIEQEQYVVITASNKVGKTQFASYIYLYHALDYAFEHKDQCSIHIIYFALEESIARITQRYMSYLLWKFDGERIPPTDLRSTSADFPLPDEILEKLRSQKYLERLKFFEENVQFETEDTNPTGVLRVCEEYAKKVGTYKTKKIRSRGNIDKEIEVFDSYEQNDKNHYKIVFIDHAGLIDLERGMNLKQSMDKLSEYAVKYLRNRYRFTVVWIQQQAMDSEGLEAIKQKKMTPSVANLGDTKYTARDANLVMSLFDPSQFGLPNWLGYKIADVDGMGLQNYGRFAKVERGRDGEQGGICPLFFDGAVCNFEELPPPDNINAITQYYTRVKNNKSYRQQRKLQALTSTVLIIIKRIFKRNEKEDRCNTQ